MMYTPLVSPCQFVQDWRKDTALVGACQCGHAATARVLLEHGAVADYQKKVINIYLTNYQGSLFIS